MNKKAPKVSIWKYLLYYIIGMIPLYVLVCTIYPVNENNELIMPDHVTMMLVTAPVVVSWALGQIEKASKQKKSQQSYVSYRKTYDATPRETLPERPKHGPTVTKMMEKFEREEKEFEEEMRLMHERFENEMLSMKQTAAELQWRQETSGLSKTEYELRRIDGMDGTVFENWCVDLLLRSGFETAERTGKSGDQGVDIVATKEDLRYAIQCKCYSSPLGNSPVQEVAAGKAVYNCHIGAVMTNSTFTKNAVELAKINSILLWDREHLRHMLERGK